MRHLINPQSSAQANWAVTIKDGVIYFSLISEGTSGGDWVSRLKDQGYRLDKLAEERLRSSRFIVTSGRMFQIAILPGSLFSDTDRREEKIWELASRLQLQALSPEAACLIREYISDNDLKVLGLWWLKVMESPAAEGSKTLGIDRCGLGNWLTVSYGPRPDGTWGRDGGFAFLSLNLNPGI